MNKGCLAIISLFCIALSLPGGAENIESGDSSAILELLGLSTKDKRLVTAPLFDFSPISASRHAAVPGFADPLGTGLEHGLNVFSGKVYFADLLGHFSDDNPDDADSKILAAESLKGIDLLDNYAEVYLSYNGRAFDRSLWNLQRADVTERNGLPVTSETSPLSLAGFGSVSEHVAPLRLHWTYCRSKDKRRRSMIQSMNKGRGPCSVPEACQCVTI